MRIGDDDQGEILETMLNLMLGQDIGFVIGSTFFGWVAQALGSYAAPYTAAAAVMMLPLLAYIFFVLPDYKRQLAARQAH